MKKIYFLISLLFASTAFSQTPNVLRLKITGNGGSDETIIRLRTGSTFGFDGSYDAYKLISNLAPQTYSLLPNGSMLSINAVPEIASEYDFPVCARVYVDGQYTYNATGLLSFPSTLQIFLIDQLTNSIRNLKTDSNSVITAKVTDSYNRFIIRFAQKPVNPNSLLATAISASQINLSLTANSYNNSIVLVYNQSGIFSAPPEFVAPGQVNTAFAGGTILYKGAPTNISHNNLNSNQRYYYKAYYYNSLNSFSPGITTNALTLMPPSISLNNSMGNFGSTPAFTSSNEQSFLVSATNAPLGINLISSAHFKISLQGGANFEPMDTIQIQAVSGSILNKEVFVKFIPTGCGIITENLTVCCGGMSPNLLSVTGIGIPAQKTCNIKLFLEGLFNTETYTMNEAKDGTSDLPAFGTGIADHINVELVDAINTSQIVYRALQENLGTDGLVTFNLPSEYNGHYYLKVSSRNHLETWSSGPVSFSDQTINYDFSDLANKAFAYTPTETPQSEVANGFFAFFAGDLNQDGVVDSQDFLFMEPDLTTGATGLLSSDLNGSGYVDSSDFLTLEPRLSQGVYVQKP